MIRPRLLIGGLGTALSVAALAWAATGLPAFGHYNHAYGRVVARSAVPDRSATNSVTATTFDYRGFDTLGEEFILFIAVVGVVVLLRRLRAEREQDEHGEGEQELGREDLRASTGERWLGAAAVGPVALLAVYVIVHGQLTPGGGFQGGVILMAAATLLALGGESALLLRLRSSSSPLEMVEAAGAAAFTMIAFGGLIAGGVFFFNFIADGHAGLLTAGVIPLDNISVGVEVAGALLMVTSELFDQRLRSGE
jgi:multicomponent Na+:H+ antiporter subunit B